MEFSDYDPIKSPVHYPTPMARYGKVPGKEHNIFRIVNAATVRMLVKGTWSTTGVPEHKWLPAYSHLKEVWIMEKWLTVMQAFGKNPGDWMDESELVGEYHLCHVFEGVSPADANIEKLISWIEAGQRHSFAQVRQAIQADYDLEEKDRKNAIRAVIRDALPSFGTGGYVGPYGSRGTKTQALRGASEMGLPTSGNKFMSGKGVNAKLKTQRQRSRSKRPSVSA